MAGVQADMRLERRWQILFPDLIFGLHLIKRDPWGMSATLCVPEKALNAVVFLVIAPDRAVSRTDWDSG